MTTISRPLAAPLVGDAGADRAASRRVLNVGGSHKNIPIPDYYVGWDHLLLDIDLHGAPDIVCDARLLGTLPAAQFDAVYV